MDATQIIQRPLITEKSTWESGARNRYAFKVHPEANKQMISQAIRELYKVRVTGVATLIRKGKKRRTRYGFSKTQDWKKAVVELHPEDRIDLF